MKSLTPEVRQQLLNFPVGTIVETQNSEYIGHVVGYHMYETRDYWSDWSELKKSEIKRFTYQLRVKWASETTSYNDDVESAETIVDFNDVKKLEL